jgi:putative lipoic acid-binding regulatory protein
MAIDYSLEDATLKFNIITVYFTIILFGDFMYKRIIFSSLALVLLSSAFVFEANLPKAEASVAAIATIPVKISVVDTNQLASKTKQGLESRKEIEQKQMGMSQVLQREAQQLQKGAAELENQKEALNESVYNQKNAELAKKQRDLERNAQSAKDEVTVMVTQKQDELIKDIVDAVTVYAQKNGIDEVRDKASGAIIYSSSKIDCTANVIEIMDKQYDNRVILAKNKNNETTQLVELATNKSPVV